MIAPDPQEPLRLQIIMARSGFCSRRKAEEYITQGKVCVDGIPVLQLGTKVKPDARITVNGVNLRLESKMHYLLLNKPAGYLCAMSDGYGRPLAVDLFKPDIKERVYNVGRLDLYSSGLIVFTNDGDFAAGLSHPSSNIIKKYRVTTDQPVPAEFLDDFINGINDNGEVLKAEQAELISDNVILISLREGKNREIRRALAVHKLHARVLHRIAIGPVESNDLPSGKWRPLQDFELAGLKKMFSGSVISRG
ncbi:MAG: rRNA pseudouridine synthase [Spirochaetes bacterium]|nr:rRNA pseudouridine synthase [Spirochaetota bacterium]